jgi:hypothetical protein
VSDLADYTHLMLGHANQTRPSEDLTLAAAFSAGTPAGKRHARGVPIIGVGSAGGTIQGTDPLQALLEKAEEHGW